MAGATTTASPAVGATARTASERHHPWLRERGAVPVAYGGGVDERIASAAGKTPVAAFIDLVGNGYVELALELGVARDRIDTIVDFPAMQKYGVKFEGGTAAASAATLAQLAQPHLSCPFSRSNGRGPARACSTVSHDPSGSR